MERLSILTYAIWTPENKCFSLVNSLESELDPPESAILSPYQPDFHNKKNQIKVFQLIKQDFFYNVKKFISLNIVTPIAPVSSWHLEQTNFETIRSLLSCMWKLMKKMKKKLSFQWRCHLKTLEELLFKSW